jgi:hypothetical protein
MFLEDDAWQPGLLAGLAERSEIREGRSVYFDCEETMQSMSAKQGAIHVARFIII